MRKGIRGPKHVSFCFLASSTTGEQKRGLSLGLLGNSAGDEADASYSCLMFWSGLLPSISLIHFFASRHLLSVGRARVCLSLGL